MAAEFARFRSNEWEQMKALALNRFKRDVLGKRPTTKEVRKTLPNPHTITELEWLAMLLLIILFVFTSFKVGALAVPFAENALVVLAQHTYIDPNFDWWFKAVTAVLFSLLTAPGLIYFKLLDREPEIRSEKASTDKYSVVRKFSLDWITPRLPYIMVYLSVAWLFVVSAQLPGTPFEQFLPVIAEVALATLVGNILKKRKDFNTAVAKATEDRAKPYDTRLEKHEADPAYLRILYQIMRDNISLIKRDDPNSKKPVKVNAWIEGEPDAHIHSIVVEEYHRLTSGTKFAAEILHEDQTATALPVTETAVHAKRILGDGGQWTPDLLVQDLRAHGVDPKSDYGEKEIARDYAPGYGARSAWRNGGKQQFRGI